MKKVRNELRCQICGERWDASKVNIEEVMFMHMILEHPFDLLQHPKVLEFFRSVCENIGMSLGKRLKGA